MSGPSASNLPEQLTSFVGRFAELAQVRELLGEARLVTLVGAGGCGKTRLALQAAAGARERFEDGVWWVELAALEDPELLATTVSSALGLRERPGQPPLDALREHLRDKRALVVLDNCEHLLDAAAALAATLLRSSPGLVLLATSRETLAVPGEFHYRVPSLSLPADSSSLAASTESDAVRLFLDRAVQARPGLELTEDNAAAVGAICRGLGGIPLAIELAAARMRMLPPERIAGQLHDRFRLLTDGGRTAPPRHQTLRASIDWSLELCSEQEQVLLRRLSVWTGACSLEGAEAVSSGDGLARDSVLGLLAGLVDKSLVDTEERDGDIRYSMLETIRQYAADRLAEAGEVGATRARHATWCLELAESAEPELVRHDGGVWLRRLEADAANLRAAIDWAVAHDPDVALHLAGALTFFWLMLGRLEEGAAVLKRVLDVAPEPSARRGKVLWGLAYLSIYRGRFDTTREYAELALGDGEAVGDPSVMARALTTQGLILNVIDPLGGREPLERSLELAREAGDTWCAADAARMLGAGYMLQSEHEVGRPLQEEAYTLARELGYRPFHAWYFKQRATAELEHGRVRTAREFADQAASIAKDVGEPVLLGGLTALLVECDVLEGLVGDGRGRGEPSLEFVRRAGIRSAEGWIQNALALVEIAEGSPDAARVRIEGLQPIFDVAPAYDQVAQARRSLGFALFLLGDLDGAEGEAQQLLAHAKSGRNEHLRAHALLLLGRVVIARGGVAEAEQHLHESLAAAAPRDFRPVTVSVLESLAHVASLTESPTEAARLLAAVRAARELLGIVRWPPEPELWTGVENAVRTELGADAFAASSEEGDALSVEGAVEYATRARGTRKRPPRGWESLTPTELEVVRHAAAGLTNPEIGERMFISRATVKAHLSHIFAKLGISARTELAAEAARRGIDEVGRADVSD